MVTKVEYTKNFIKKHDIDITLDDALNDWWMTRRTGEALTLSDAGYDIHVQCKLTPYTFDSYFGIVTVHNNSMLGTMALLKYMPCPYYQCGPKIIVFDEDIAIMMSLAGDITTFLESQPSRW